MKIHLNLATRNLDASIEFYRTLLGVEPAKRYSDYALFLTEDPGLELALDVNPAVNVSEGMHYGIVVDAPEGVESAIARFRSARYPIDIETNETCCYAVQDKVWATDPDGRRWETYFVIAEAGERESATTTCCRTDAAVAAPESACC